ncbi:MAG: hypothetical protein ACQETJ_05995 [Bacteroidota bacterium]
MKKVLILLIIALLGPYVLHATTPAEKGEIIGEWKYESQHAPYGYEKGSIIISEKEGKLAGEVKFADGYKLPLRDVTYADGELKCKFTVDYNEIAIKATIDGTKMKGTADSPEGALPFTAEKAKE